MENSKENYNENGEKEIYFFRLLKVMFHRKIVLGAITSVVLVGGTAGLTLTKNNTVYYKSSFSYNLMEMENNRYIDGTYFNYQDIISKSNLEQIKNSNPEYNNILIGNMVDSSLLNIEVKLDENKNRIYTLTVPKKVFKNSNQAKQFITDIVNTPINYTNDAIDSLMYDRNLENFGSLPTYEQQIKSLEKQYDLLLKKYDLLIEKYNDICYNGEYFISDEKENIINYFQENSFTNLYNEIDKNGYVKNPTNEKNELEFEKDSINNKMEYNTKKINSLKQIIESILENATTSVDLDSYNEAITELTIENIDYEEKINSIDKKLSTLTTAPSSYVEKLNSYKGRLQEYTKDYKKVEKTIVSSYNVANYQNSKIITTENEPSLVKNVLISLILGLFISCIVNVIIDRKYLYEDYPTK